METLEFSAEGISVEVDLLNGHLKAFSVTSEERTLVPLHRAPWIGEPDLPATISPGGRRLSGDFLCAPFSTNDIEPAPMHGWTANSRWLPTSDEKIDGGRRVSMRLEKSIFGAVVVKNLTVRDGHPFLYQEHLVIGGNGEIPIAHHPMTLMKMGGNIAYSPKRLAVTPSIALEPDPARGRSILKYPARTANLSEFPRSDGGTYDLNLYPAEGSNEDFVTLIEAEGRSLGWSAVSRQAESDLVLFLKHPAVLPVTMLWISNGGRDYAPWSGRHRGVIGIEDGRAAMGHQASIGDNELKALGVPTSFMLSPNGQVRVRQVIGVLPLADPGVVPRKIVQHRGKLHLTFDRRKIIVVPFDDAFLISSFH